MEIKIKKLTDTSTLPTKAHPTDACFDIYADCPNDRHNRIEEWNNELVTIIEAGDGVIIEPDKSVTIHTGFATEIPDGYFAAVFPRSGMGIKRHLRLSNGTGIIDSPYRGEWMVSLYNDGDETQVIHHRDRIAQFAILPVLDVSLKEVDELNETDRNCGGFGSSGQ